MAPSDQQSPSQIETTRIETRTEDGALVHTPTLRGAPLWLRLGALLYDAVLLFCVLAVAVWMLIYPYELIAARPFPTFEPVYAILKQIYLLAIVVGFYVYFWTHGGQTLGLRAWRLRVQRNGGGPLSARDALRRFGWATLSLLPAGLGLWWSLIDREGLAWHDRKSHTRIVRE